LLFWRAINGFECAEGTAAAINQNSAELIQMAIGFSNKTNGIGKAQAHKQPKHRGLEPFVVPPFDVKRFAVGGALILDAMKISKFDHGGGCIGLGFGLSFSILAKGGARHKNRNKGGGGKQLFNTGFHGHRTHPFNSLVL